MLYIFNDKVVYDDTQCSLTNIDTNDTILLPATASRLLSLFIKYQGTTLTRTEILNSVWDEYGYKASNNTLSQYISLIRKNFQLLGDNTEFLITIPRTGFVLTTKVEVRLVESLTDASSFVSTLDNPLTPLEHTESLASFHTEHTDNSLMMTKDNLSSLLKENDIKYFHYINVLSFIILCSVLLLFYLYRGEIKTTKLYLAGKIDSCSVYTLYKSSKDLIGSKLVTIEHIAKDKLPCVANNFYISQLEDSLLYDKTGRLFISRCGYQDNISKVISTCKSLFTHE